MISQKVRQQEKGREGVNLATNSPFTEGFLKLKNVYIYIILFLNVKIKRKQATRQFNHFAFREKIDVFC